MTLGATSVESDTQSRAGDLWIRSLEGNTLSGLHSPNKRNVRPTFSISAFFLLAVGLPGDSLAVAAALETKAA